MQSEENLSKPYPKDTVILHQFPRGDDKPTFSVFCLKLETWLRINNIKYQNELAFLTKQKSSKGKLPFITLNDTEVADSSFAIDYLAKQYGKDLDEHLTTLEKSIGRAFFKLTEESFKWAFTVHRLKYGTAKDMGMTDELFNVMGSKILVNCNAQGYGLHQQDEIYQIGNADLKAIETYLGDKKYFFGDEISMVDVEIFSLIAQIPFYDRGEFNKYFRESCPNLIRHYNTIREKIWPEWNISLTNL